MTKFKLYTTLIIITCGLISSILCDECYKHQFPDGGIACVCNKTHCDTLATDKIAQPGFLLTYESDITGKRLHRNVTRLVASSATDIIMNIDRNETHQTIHGFGGSFTDAAGVNIFSLPESMSQRLIQDYFGPDGLEYNMGRVPMGCTDFSPRNYSYNEVADDFDLKNFELAPEDKQYKIPLIKLALRHTGNKLKLLGSLWSAPIWLKTNTDHNGMGIIRGDPGGPYYRTLAKYHIKFLDEYQKLGVTFWGITSVNEPAGGLKPRWQNPCVGMSPEMIRDWIKTDLGPLLESSGYGKEKLHLIINDEIMSMLGIYAKNILKDPEAAKYVTGVGVHWYEYGYEPYTPMDTIRTLYPDKFLISTEACEGWGGEFQGVRPGNWTRAETYAWDIINILNHHGTGWIDWNMALNMMGGPNYVNNVADSPIIVDAKNSVYYKQPMFYALGHFSKFVRPGSKKLFSVDNIDDPMIKAVAFLDPNGQVVLIFLNRKTETVSVAIAGANNANFTFLIELSPRSIKTVIVPKLAQAPTLQFSAQETQPSTSTSPPPLPESSPPPLTESSSSASPAESSSESPSTPSTSSTPSTPPSAPTSLPPYSDPVIEKLIQL